MAEIIYREYFSSRAQWRAVGCTLGVSAADLEAVEINQRGRCEDCFLLALRTETKLIQAMWDVTEDEEFVIRSGTDLHSAPFSIAIIIVLLSDSIPCM